MLEQTLNKQKQKKYTRKNDIFLGTSKIVFKENCISRKIIIGFGKSITLNGT